MDTKAKASAYAREWGIGLDGRFRAGKFEGESWYAPYYWDCVLNGDGEDIDGEYPASLFQVNAEESDAFGLPCGSWILVRESSGGFVFVTNHATREEAERRYNDWIGA